MIEQPTRVEPGHAMLFLHLNSRNSANKDVCVALFATEARELREQLSDALAEVRRNDK